jgi:parallel beta-helix repeat protein
MDRTGAGQVPKWILISEAASLSGRSQASLELLMRSGQIKSVALARERTGDPRLYLLRTSDLVRLGLMPKDDVSTLQRPSGMVSATGTDVSASSTARAARQPSYASRAMRVAAALVLLFSASLALPPVRATVGMALMAGGGAHGSDHGKPISKTCHGRKCSSPPASPSPSPSPSPNPSPSPSPSPSPNPSPSPSPSETACSGVNLSPGSSLQTIINSYPSNTTFCLASGTYSIATPINPKAGDRFIAVTPRQVILTGNNVTSMAFNGQGVYGVEVQGLVITRFAPLAQGGMAALKASNGWRIINNDISYNVNTGLYHEADSIVRGNFIHHNSRMGLGGYRASNSIIENNEVAFNGFAGGPDNGGSKWVGAINLTVRNNYFHDNYNNALWIDGDNLNVTIESNTVVNNQHEGIQYEVSCAGVIRNNRVQGNGGAGVEVTASQNVEVLGNTLLGNGKGVTIWHQDRGSGGNCPWALKNVRIHDNAISASTGYTGLTKYNVSDGDTIFDPSDGRVKFYGNTYYLSGIAKYFHWANNLRSIAEWKGYGQDVNGTFS